MPLACPVLSDGLGAPVNKEEAECNRDSNQQRGRQRLHDVSLAS